MINAQLQSEIFEKICSDPVNKCCFECGANSNAWASVNNGIFLCLNCSGIHRGFGVNVSFMRSVDMDSWTQKQINLMLQGGNQKLRRFFEKYNIPKDAPMDFKYKTKAGVFYREMLKCIAEGSPVPEAPSEEEALDVVSFSNPNFAADMRNNKGISNQQEGNRGQKDDIDIALDQIKSVFNSAVDKTSEVTKAAGVMTTQAIKRVDDKWNDPQFQQNLKIAKDKTVLTAKKGFETVKTGLFGAFSFLKNKIDEKLVDQPPRQQQRDPDQNLTQSTEQWK